MTTRSTTTTMATIETTTITTVMATTVMATTVTARTKTDPAVLGVCWPKGFWVGGSSASTLRMMVAFALPDG